MPLLSRLLTLVVIFSMALFLACFFSRRRRHTSCYRDWSSDVCSSDLQPPLPRERLILPHDAPGAGDRTELDALIVGAGPAGLACGIELARLARAGGVDLTIGVLEKADALGEHSLSGAVVNPRPFGELFPDLKDSDFPFRGPVTKEAVYLLTANGQWRLPIPPTM